MMRNSDAVTKTLSLLCLLLPAMASGGENCLQADTLFNQSLQEKEAGRREQKLEAAVASCPTHVQALNNLAVLREDNHQLAAAEALYRRVLAVQPDFAQAHAGLGDVLAARQEDRAAVEAYRKFLDLLQFEEKEGRHSPLLAQRATYQQRLRGVQQRINPEKTVSADAIVASLSQPQVTTRTRRGIGVVVELPKIDLHIHFTYNSDKVQEGSLKQVEEVARALQSASLQQTRIRIEGHTDGDGAPDYNRELSSRRAEEVRSLLVNQFHIPADRFEIVGKGKSYPVASNETDTGKALNRRVTFVNLGN